VSARHLVIGLDGADVDVIDAIGPEKLPTLARLRSEGAWSRLRSLPPYATLPNWASFLTGLDPGQHGVFDFTTRVGTKVAFTAGTVREAPTIAARLDALGLSTACLGFPGTWPPERLAHGLFLSGWDSPVAFEADASFVWPTERYAALRERFGPLIFDEVDEMGAERAGWHADLGPRLVQRIEQRIEMGKALLAERPWALFMIYFGESDTASHHLFAHFDPRSPRHPALTTQRERDGLVAVYAALDRAVSALLAAAGPGVELTVLSDHGSGGSSDVVVHLNRSLAEAQLLSFRPSSRTSAITSLLRGPLLAALPGKARDRLFRALGRALPGWLESRSRFAAIDLPNTRVFSDELNYFPALHLNLRGREPHGCVDPSDRRAIERELEGWAESLRDADTGERIIDEVVPREELYQGPFVDRAPDYVLRLRTARGYAYNIMPASGPGPAVEKLDPRDHLGRKGRSLPGAHRPRGLYLAHGPSVRPGLEVDAGMLDVTATLLHRMGLRPDDAMGGRILRELLVEEGQGAQALPPATLVPRGKGDLALTEARLRALGYIE
jgi:predicted AlkP superfamily phosphohydrolase/phosphomutase